MPANVSPLDIDHQPPEFGVDPGADARALVLQQREVDVRARTAIERAGPSCSVITRAAAAFGRNQQSRYNSCVASLVP